MKKLNLSGTKSLRNFFYSSLLIACSQLLMSCSGSGGSTAVAVATPVPYGIVGGTSFNMSTCMPGAAGVLACAMGTYAQGLEILIQVIAPNAVYGSIDSYAGPVTVNGVVNILAGYVGCTTETSFNFSGTLNYNSLGADNFQGTLMATGPTSTLQLTFANPFLTPANGVSSTNQNFGLRLLGNIQITPIQGNSALCTVPTNQYTFN